MALVDSFIEENVKLRNKMGVHSVIIRQVLGNCCEWCQNLAGTYDADDAPRDIYRRHDNCKCMVVFKSDKGKYTDAWTKQEFNSYRNARITATTNIQMHSNTKEIVAFFKETNYKHGNVTYDPDCKIAKMKHERKCAEWLTNIFGGEIKILKAVNKNKIKTPDYLWEGKLWDLKSASSLNSIDKQLQSGIHQIRRNPGGVILELQPGIKLSEEKIRQQIKNRLARSSKGMNISVIVKEGINVKMIVSI